MDAIDYMNQTNDLAQALQNLIFRVKAAQTTGQMMLPKDMLAVQAAERELSNYLRDQRA